MQEIINKRRTFAIISHPDAGKTTLTEKFLLYGGAIQLAGQVRAKGDARRARSDFMQLEKDRGISVSTSTMSFPYKDIWINLIDTPGHNDFSEDTYRALTAVDSAIMVIDGAKGIESQTKKLFEICRLREIPIITFCNKMDRESRDYFEIIDEIQEALTIDVTPFNWPVGTGASFVGCIDTISNQINLIDRAEKNIVARTSKIEGLDDPKINQIVPQALFEKLQQEIEMVKELLPKFDSDNFLKGYLSPIWFGSALNSFGVKDLLDGISKYAPPPQERKAKTRVVRPAEEKVSGFVFKVHANMDKKHRDRVAFMRLCSGHFRRGMKLKHVRTDKFISVSNPVMFMAKDRELAEDAWSGDIIGIPNHGQIRLGDTFTEGEIFQFTDLPSFAPELLKTVTSRDPMKSKHLQKALTQFAEEGLTKLFKPSMGARWMVGVVGALQFDVLESRIKEEYGLPVSFENTSFISARWLNGCKIEIDNFVKQNLDQIALDHEEDPVFLIRLQWDLDRVSRDYPNIEMLDKKDIKVS